MTGTSKNLPITLGRKSLIAIGLAILLVVVVAAVVVNLRQPNAKTTEGAVCFTNVYGDRICSDDAFFKALADGAPCPADVDIYHVIAIDQPGTLAGAPAWVFYLDDGRAFIVSEWIPADGGAPAPSCMTP